MEKLNLKEKKKVMNLASSWCIVRTSTPYGIHPTKKSFPLWVIQNIKEKKEINVVVDQFTSPTYVPNLSHMLIEIAKRQLVGINPSCWGYKDLKIRNGRVDSQQNES